MRQILWGLFMKIVIADSCAIYANQIFDGFYKYSGSTLVLGAVLFSFQIYGDFAGYSNIAIGTARLFGFDLTQNFKFPYFSRDIAEFWRRWHISLSTWFRDYLYIPLGGSRGSIWIKIRNVFIIFIVSGFWHGANWTFIIWGGLNALYFLPVFLTNNNRKNLDTVAQGKYFPSIKEFLFMILTFGLTVFAWIFFRAENITHAVSYISHIFSKSLFSIPEIHPKNLFIILFFFIIIEWLGRNGKFALENIHLHSPKAIRYILYLILIFSILLLSGGKEQEFIYFQF